MHACVCVCVCVCGVCVHACVCVCVCVCACVCVVCVCVYTCILNMGAYGSLPTQYPLFVIDCACLSGINKELGLIEHVAKCINWYQFFLLILYTYVHFCVFSLCLVGGGGNTHRPTELHVQGRHIVT